jgi:hypothetical protein
VDGGVTSRAVDGPIGDVPFEKSMEDIEVVNSVRGEGEGEGVNVLYLNQMRRLTYRLRPILADYPLISQNTKYQIPNTKSQLR